MEMLRSIPLFREVSPATEKALREALQPRRFEKGETILHHGSPYS
jgi:hypothetical protein